MLTLSERSNLDHLRKQAKDLLRLYRAGEASALNRLRQNLPAARGKTPAALLAMALRLHDMQSCLAREHGFAKLKVGTKDDRAPHKQGNFPTPTGKCMFYVEGAKNFVAGPFRQMYEGFQPLEDLDPLPGYVPNRESADTNPALAAKYPLNIISPKSHGFLNSCYANVADKIKGQGEQFVMLSPKDAQARSIREGDPVRVFNDRGDFEGFARVTDDVQEGVIVATLGYWRSLNRSDGSVNSISSDAFCSLGRAPTFSDNLVQVVRVN